MTKRKSRYRLASSTAAAVLLTAFVSAASHAAPFDPDTDLGAVARALPSNSPVPKIIVISLDGAKPDFIQNYIATHVLPQNSGLGLLLNKGSRATQNVTTTTSLTAVAHLAIATGSTDVHNDVPSNTFHAVAGTIASTISGFGAPIGGYSISPLQATANPTAVPMWVPLRAAGKKVVTATWPGGDGADIRVNGTIVQGGNTATRKVDYTLPFGAFGGVGAQGFILTLNNFGYDATIESQLAAAGHPSFSPVQVTNVPFETLFCGNVETSTCGTTNANRPISYNMKAAALDTTNDNHTNYDTLVFFDSNAVIPAGPFSAPHTGPAYAKRGRSAPFFFEGSAAVVGAAYYVVNMNANLSEVKFIRYGAAFIPRNAAVIGDVTDVNNNVGFWAPQPDFRIPERIPASAFIGFTDKELEATHEDQVKTWTKYQTQVALHAIDQNPDADLVMLYFEQPDGSEHQYLLTDPRQATNPANAASIGAQQDHAKVARYAKYIQNSYQRANSAVEAIIKKVGKRFGVPRSNIIVVSDHGFAPFHTAVGAGNLLNAALTAGGFSTSLNGTSIVIRTSGPAANIYVNLAGRESGGTVDNATYQALVDAVANYLQNVTDPNPTFNGSLTNQKLFTHVFVRPQPPACAQAVGFCTSADVGQDSGDIVALLDVGYNFDGTQTPGIARKGDPAFNAATTVLSVPNFYGAHGHHASIPAMSASFFAAGPNIRSGVVVDQMHNIDVAPTIMQLLGVPAAPTVDGTAVSQILK